MSASPPPTPDELVAELGVTPEDAQQIADAMEPLQDVLGVGSAVGNGLADLDAPGPALVGTMMEQMALQVNAASTSAELLARAGEFYFESQVGSFEDLFPPPDKVAERAGEDAMPAIEALSRIVNQQ